MKQSFTEWFSGKIFSAVHGNNLVYNTCWEDPRLDKKAMEIGPDDTILVITSAGCNTLSYALDAPKQIFAIDMNPRQNALLELKIAGIRSLDFETFFRLFGNGHLPDAESVYRKKLRSQLCDWSRYYWDAHIKKYFAKSKSFYFCGTSGRFARGINFYIDYVGHFRKAVRAMLAAQSLEEQKRIWYTQIREKLWSWMVRFFVNRDSSLALLGVPRAQRMQIEATYEGEIYRFVQDCLDEVFGELPIIDNYFWRVYATGSYTKTCCPDYLKEENFNALKGGLVDRIDIITDTVADFLNWYDGTISRYVLLDHQDWLCGRLYPYLIAEWNAILAKAAPKTRIIWRSGGLSTEYIDAVPVDFGGKQQMLGELLNYNWEEATRLHKLDRVHTYGSFYIADLRRDDRG